MSPAGETASTRGAAASGPHSSRAATRLLAVIAVVLVIAALKASEPVTLPLCIAVFVIMLAWPVQVWLRRRVPGWLAFLSTVIVILLGFGLVAGAFVFSLLRLTEVAPDLVVRVESLTADATAWARSHGLPVPSRPAAGDVTERLAPLIGAVLAKLYSLLGLLGLVLAFFLLGLLEVRDFEARIERRLRARVGDAILETAGLIASKVRRHLLALTITSAVSGLATGLYALAVGLDLALTWGAVAFLLNYIPTLGPAVAVIPPTLFAVLQFDGLSRPALVFLGIGAIQFVMGNFVDPKIEGRVLKLSPFVVLLAIVFWGWVWGVFGAFLAVPLAIAVVVVCDQFDGTRWVAKLMTGTDAEGEGDAVTESNAAAGKKAAGGAKTAKE